jgi:hypothetical protein
MHGWAAFVWSPSTGMRFPENVLTVRGVDLTGWELEEPRSEPQPYFAGISFNQ